MDEFIAKDRLNPEDFKNFARQCTNDVERAERRVRECEADLRRAENSLADWKSILANNKLYCEKHGVPLNAV